MTSIGPYTQSYDLSHMYSIPDLRSIGPVKQNILPSSILGIINSHPDFRKFKYILNLSGLSDRYADPQESFTLFVPSDATISKIPEEIFINMDSSVARNIVKTSTLKRRIPSELLEDSPASHFITTDPINKLFITNISGRTVLNECINIIHKDQPACNGIIHVVDGLLWPAMI